MLLSWNFYVVEQCWYPEPRCATNSRLAGELRHNITHMASLWYHDLITECNPILCLILILIWKSPTALPCQQNLVWSVICDFKTGFIFCVCYYLASDQDTLNPVHYFDVIMSVTASQITSLTIVYWTVYSGKENIKAPRHWPLCGEFMGDRLIPRTKGQ